LIPAGTGSTKIKWQKTADERDNALKEASPETPREEQLTST